MLDQRRGLGCDRLQRLRVLLRALERAAGLPPFPKTARIFEDFSIS